MHAHYQVSCYLQLFFYTFFFCKEIFALTCIFYLLHSTVFGEDDGALVQFSKILGGQSSSSVPEMQAQIEGLKGEVARLHKLLKS